MIFATLAELKRLGSLSPAWDAALLWLQKADLATLAEGNYDILDKEAFAFVAIAVTQPEADRAYEWHEQYTDIQIALNGEETIAYGTVMGEITKPYAPDIGKCTATPLSRVTIVPGGPAAVYFPKELHSPCIQAGASMPVQKLVVKVIV